MGKLLVLLQVIAFSSLFTVSACAETPSSPVSEKADNGPAVGGGSAATGEEHEEENSIVSLALKYEGKDTLNRTCNFYVAIEEGEEEDEEHEHEHGHHMLVKMDYTTVDGHTPHAGEGQFFLYDSNSGKYFDAGSNQPNTILSLMSLSLKDPNVEPDVNQLNDYITNKTLEQYIRVELAPGSDAEEFEEALDAVLEGESSINDKLDIFDSVQIISLGTAHGDHYHFPTCLNQKPVAVVETEFELEGHEHEHEEGEDHDHDHE